MSLIEELAQSARTFLANHPIHVDPGCDALPQGVHRFGLAQGSGSMVVLQPHDGRGKAIKAHWLPWASEGATTMVLAPDQTHIFFTSEMSGCRFTYEEQPDGRVRVAHLAGNIKVAKPTGKGEYTGGFGRNKAQDVMFGPGPHPLLRSLSYTEYGPNWAFVVGNFAGGHWKFVAQINRGDGVAQAVEVDRALTIQ